VSARLRFGGYNPQGTRPRSLITLHTPTPGGADRVRAQGDVNAFDSSTAPVVAVPARVQRERERTKVVKPRAAAGSASAPHRSPCRRFETI